MMKKSLTLLSLMAAVSVTFYQCGGGTDTPSTTDGGAQTQAENPAPAPAEQSADTGSGAALASGGIGKWDKDDWYTNKTVWVGNMNEFDLKDGDVEGKPTLRANVKVAADNRVRDLFIAKKMEGLEGGKTYKISVNYKFDSEKPGILENADEDQFMKMQNMKAFNYIQYAVQDGDQASRRPISQIEDYAERPVETTKYVDAATIGDGAFHTLEATHTLGEAETTATLMMIVRFRAETDINANWLYLQDFKVEPVS